MKIKVYQFFAWFCLGLCTACYSGMLEYEGKVDIYKVDSDSEKELVKAFNVRSIPTLMFVPVEGQPQVGCGAVSKGELKHFFNQVFHI